MASLGLITGVLHFNGDGTACNVTEDGAMTLIPTGYAEKHNHPPRGDHRLGEMGNRVNMGGNTDDNRL